MLKFSRSLAKDDSLLDLLTDWGQSDVNSPWAGIVPWRAKTNADDKQSLFEEFHHFLPAPRDNISSFPALDPHPNVVFLPGLGVVTAAATKTEADSLLHFVVASLPVIRDIIKTGQLKRSLAGVLLSRSDLSINEVEFVGQVALITGAASGIGSACVYQFAREGAHIVIVDLNKQNADIVAAEINRQYGSNRAISVQCDVGNETEVIETFREMILTYGGMDIVVNNAGFAMSKTIEDTLLKEWDHIQNVMATGYFLISREAFRILRPQRMGGRLVFVCSKNSVRAGKEIAAYSSAKALELHMARCLAEEGGNDGIRVNSVLPDAVLKGSSLFDPALRADRAAQYGISADELENYYIQRCVLKVPVYPEHVAEAVVFFASDRSSRTTGGALAVDGGVSTAYLR